MNFDQWLSEGEKSPGFNGHSYFWTRIHAGNRDLEDLEFMIPDLLFSRLLCGIDGTSENIRVYKDKQEAIDDLKQSYIRIGL